MPTVEERLAALETKLAALTDTTPTNYYEHQYSGEEIDAAVGRALAGGALDTSVTNVSNQLGTFARPNLLDNWYFGNPVDQRGWMLQLAGTMLYSDAACTQAMFPSTKTTSIIKVSDIVAHPSDDSTVYVKLADCVRGYTGNGYTVDRWKMQQDIGIILLEADGIILDATSNALTLVQFFGSDLLRELAGNTLTWSVMYTVLEQSGNPGGIGYTIPGNYFAQAIMSGAAGKLCVAYGSAVCPDNLEHPAHMYIPKGCKIKLLAAKLELGPTQTLAHQENGVWVLNEVPDYGEQLRRCLRHDYILGNASQNCPIGIGTAYSNDGVVCVIQLPEYMRTNPAVALSGEVQIRFSSTQILTATSVLNYGFSGDKVQLYFPGLSGLTPGQSCDLFTQANSRLEFNSNL